jgi:hypothetical protein
MSYETFRHDIIQKDGAFYTERLEQFFTKAVELAQEEKFDEALKIGNDALVLAKYSNADYAVLYFIGMLCQAHLESGQPEIANQFFKVGMDIIEKGEAENKDTYIEDINSFLDLKILIDEELKGKSGA